MLSGGKQYAAKLLLVMAMGEDHDFPFLRWQSTRSLPRILIHSNHSNTTHLPSRAVLKRKLVLSVALSLGPTNAQRLL